MLAEILAKLTPEQKHALDALDIPKSRRSEWKNERRRPTAAQAKTLALVVGIDPVPLLQWLAEQEATPAQRGLFRLFMERAGATTLTVMFTVILSGAFSGKTLAATSTYASFEGEKQDIHCRVFGLLRRLLTRQLRALLKAPTWGLFFAPAKPKNFAC